MLELYVKRLRITHKKNTMNKIFPLEFKLGPKLLLSLTFQRMGFGTSQQEMVEV